MLRSESAVRALGAVRLLAGVTLLAAPQLAGRRDDPGFHLLVRTIGIRDAVIGAGTVLASDADARHWGRIGLASDSIDIVAGAAALPRVGLAGGLVAALTPVPFAAAGAYSLLRRHR